MPSWIKLRVPAFGQPANTVLRVDSPGQVAQLLNGGFADLAADPGGSPPTVPSGSPGGDFTTDAELLDLSTDLGAALRAAYGPRMNAGYLAVTGDSITARNSGLTPNGGPSSADSWVTHLSLLSQGSLPLVTNAAHGGYTTTQLRPLFAAEVLALAPKVVGVMGGTNDALDSNGHPTETSTNLAAMVTAARAAGAAVFMGTIAPAGAQALGTPPAPTATPSTTGGTLAAGTYSYRVSAVNGVGETLASTAATVTTTGTTSSVRIIAPNVEGATAYRLYGRIGGSEKLLATNSTGGNIYVPSRLFIDTGSGTPSGGLPTADGTALAVDPAVRLKIATINAWIRRYAAAHNIPLIDFYSLLTDPATGAYIKGWCIDGTHPTPAASRRMGALAWQTLAPIVPPAPVYLAADNADPLNLIANGCLTDTAPGPGWPAGWGVYGGDGIGATETIGTKAGFIGQGFTVGLSAADSSARYHDVGGVTGASPGDRLLMAVRVQTEGCEAGGAVVDLRLRDFVGNTSLAELLLCGADAGPGVWTTEFVVPDAASVNLGISLNISSGAGTATIGQITLVNLTTGNLLTV